MGKIILNYVDSKNTYGTMNGGTVRLSNMTEADKIQLKTMHGFTTAAELEEYELTGQDKNLIFKRHRQAFGDGEGFDWKKMFMPDQTTKNGSYFEITKDYVEANPKGWSDIPEDILIITDKVPGVVAGYPVADCPVVMLEDRKQGITAVSHCSAALINQKMPMLMAEALYSGYNSKNDNLFAYVGACAGNDWTYDCWPNWATDEQLWQKAIVPQDIRDEAGQISTIFKIDVRQAILEQLRSCDVSSYQIGFNMADTITNPEYYSNAVCRKQPEKFGRQFVGAIYEDETKVKGKVK